MTPRRLVLRKETLTDLTSAELSLVHGASGPTCHYGACASDFQQCLTGLDCLPPLSDCVLTIHEAC